MSTLTSTDKGPETRRTSERTFHPRTAAQSRIGADSDWDRLTKTRRSNDRFEQWRAATIELAQHNTLQEIVVAMRELPREASNRYWSELLDLARSGDDLARRVMLQALVPFFEREINRWQTGSAAGRAEIEQLVYAGGLQAFAKLEQRSGPIEWPVLDVIRETRRVVKSMIQSDELWASTTIGLSEITPTSDGGFTSRSLSLALIDKSTQEHPAEGLCKALVELVEAGRISPPNARLVLATRTGLHTFEEIAQEEGTTPDTLRRRRHRAERAIYGALADVA